MEFFDELYTRNTPLYIFGWVCLLGSLFCGMMIFTSNTLVLGINAWIKPFKFFLSTTIFVWTMNWYLGYLNPGPAIRGYTWTVILVLVFELFWITFQASKGHLSHFNGTSSFNSLMFSLMGLAISIMTIYTFYIGILFFSQPFPDLPPSYVWGIRLGIILFVIFAFEGGMMGAQMAHTVGAPDGGPGIKLLNWSVSHGDLRIAHFVGMHALQVLPILGFYVFTTPRSIILISVGYLIVAAFVLIQALRGVPLIKVS